MYKPCPECGKHNHHHKSLNMQNVYMHCATGDVVKFFIEQYYVYASMYLSVDENSHVAFLAASYAIGNVRLPVHHLLQIHKAL